MYFTYAKKLISKIKIKLQEVCGVYVYVHTCICVSVDI